MFLYQVSSGEYGDFNYILLVHEKNFEPGEFQRMTFEALHDLGISYTYDVNPVPVVNWLIEHYGFEEAPIKTVYIFNGDVEESDRLGW